MHIFFVQNKYITTNLDPHAPATSQEYLKSNFYHMKLFVNWLKKLDTALFAMLELSSDILKFLWRDG